MTPAQNDPPIFRALYAEFHKPACCTRERDNGRRLEILRNFGAAVRDGGERMSAHTCTTLTRGCYRCELNVDEMRSIKRRDYTKTTRLWGRCEGCGCKWQWSGLTENIDSGMSMIARSGCLCMGRLS